jgi:hypothetical protein
MRMTSLAIVASLAVAPGCILAVPPIIGAGGGAILAGIEHAAGADPSVGAHLAVGTCSGSRSTSSRSSSCSGCSIRLSVRMTERGRGWCRLVPDSE